MLELRYERQVCVDAPQARVHEEITDLAALLRHVPTVDRVVVSEDGRRATFQVESTVRMLTPSRDISIELTELPMAGGVSLTTEILGLQTRCDTVMDLFAAAADATHLRCESRLVCSHPNASSLRSRLLAALEKHIDFALPELVERIGHNARADRVFEEFTPAGPAGDHPLN